MPSVGRASVFFQASFSALFLGLRGEGAVSRVCDPLRVSKVECVLPELVSVHVCRCLLGKHSH